MSVFFLSLSHLSVGLNFFITLPGLLFLCLFLFSVSLSFLLALSFCLPVFLSPLRVYVCLSPSITLFLSAFILFAILFRLLFCVLVLHVHLSPCLVCPYLYLSLSLSFSSATNVYLSVYLSRLFLFLSFFCFVSVSLFFCLSHCQLFCTISLPFLLRICLFVFLVDSSISLSLFLLLYTSVCRPVSACRSFLKKEHF